MSSGYKFKILNYDGTSSNTSVDMEDMFVRQDYFLDAGLYGSGQNAFGGIGDGTASGSPKSTPVQVGTLTTWKNISIGSNGGASAIKTDGTLWAWGYNVSGQLGTNNTTNYSSPVQVGTLTDWKYIDQSSQSNVATAIKTDGTLWTWGTNGNGELGDGTTISKSSPIQVGSLTNWKYAYQCRAIKNDGTLWSWGDNVRGQLGDGTTINKSSPIQVGSLTNWKLVVKGGKHTIAIKTDGTLWAWGDNTYGQLGDGTVANKSSPVQVGTLTNWRSVQAGDNFCIATKDDGTLWSWGRNVGSPNGYNLGDGTTINKSSPIQVGSLTNWKKISARINGVMAIKTDGTLWAWGTNVSGSLPIGLTTGQSSPVQVGSLTNWKEVSVSSTESLMISSPDIVNDGGPVTPSLQYIGKTVTSSGVNASSTITIATPTGTKAGDVIIAVAVSANRDGGHTGTGFTQWFYSGAIAASASQNKTTLLYKILTSAPAATYDFTITSGFGATVYLALFTFRPVGFTLQSGNFESYSKYETYQTSTSVVCKSIPSTGRMALFRLATSTLPTTFTITQGNYFTVDQTTANNPSLLLVNSEATPIKDSFEDYPVKFSASGSHQGITFGIYYK